MKKRKLLTALAIAYRNGIINKDSIGRWNKTDKIIVNSLKYLLPILVITGIIINIQLQKPMELTVGQTFVIQQRVIELSQIKSLLLSMVGVVFLFKLLTYMAEIFHFQTAMNRTKDIDYKIKPLSVGEFKIQIK